MQTVDTLLRNFVEGNFCASLERNWFTRAQRGILGEELVVKAETTLVKQNYIFLTFHGYCSIRKTTPSILT